MTKKNFHNEKNYMTTMILVKKLLDNGIISKSDYAEIDTKMRAKYYPVFGTLFFDIDLINSLI